MHNEALGTRLLALFACASAVLFASRAEATPPAQAVARCIPGEQVECACLGGNSGVQVCSADGSRFDACACAPPPVAPPLVSRPGSSPLVLPAAPAHIERANPGLWTAGVTLMMLGGAGVGAGIALGAAGEGCSASHESPCVAGGVSGVIGGALLITGIPLAMIGGKRIAQGPASGSDWRPRVVAGPGGGGVVWTF